MMARMLLVLAVAMLSLPVAASAQDGPGFEHFRKEADITIAPDKAYFLIRMPAESVSTKLQPVFLRKPSQQELDAYRAAKKIAHEEAGEDAGPIETFAFDYPGATNLYQLENGKFYSRADKDRIFVIAVEPGDYVFYGLGFNKFLWQCNCFGTVSFSARSGEITDLGSILITLAWKESGFPELAEDTALGKKMRQDYAMFAAGIRLPGADPVPQRLAGLPVKPAEYHAVGSFLEPARLLANRLAPIPGVLAYDGGTVIDVRTGKAVPKRF